MNNYRQKEIISLRNEKSSLKKKKKRKNKLTTTKLEASLFKLRNVKWIIVWLLFTELYNFSLPLAQLPCILRLSLSTFMNIYNNRHQKCPYLRSCNESIHSNKLLASCKKIYEKPWQDTRGPDWRTRRDVSPYEKRTTRIIHIRFPWSPMENEWARRGARRAERDNKTRRRFFVERLARGTIARETFKRFRSCDERRPVLSRQYVQSIVSVSLGIRMNFAVRERPRTDEQSCLPVWKILRVRCFTDEEIARSLTLKSHRGSFTWPV